MHLRQVLQNVSSNAIKYTPTGGTVQLGVRELEPSDGAVWFEFTCADNGIGMSESFQKHVFEPFAQEDASARTSYSGTGLGLSITKELVEQMKGSIRFESTQGMGTLFTIRLPFCVDTEAPVSQPPQPAPADIRGVRVLLVEDNALNMEIAQFLLETAGAMVTRAWNGREAVDAFAASEPGSFDVILMDVMMPVMDGLEASRTIRAMARPDAGTVPIFAMTANAFYDDIRRSREAGMNEHLTKPLEAQRCWPPLHGTAAEKTKNRSCRAARQERFCSIGGQAQAHVQRLIHPLLVGGGDLAGALPQAVFVQRADLFQQHHAVLGKAGVRRPDVDVGGQTRFVQPGCNGRCNDGGAVSVADLVLNDQHGPDAALLGADHRRQISIKNFSSVYLHGNSLPVAAQGCVPLCDAPGTACVLLSV